MMKFCTLCGESYTDRIEFCFQDGEVLRLLPAKVIPPRKREVPDPNLALIMEVAAAVHASVAAAKLESAATRRPGGPLPR